jgi:hypothetical protein
LREDAVTLPDEPVTELLDRLRAVELDDVAIRRLRQRVLEGADVGGTSAPSASGRRRGARRFLAIPALVAAGIIALWAPRQPTEEGAFAAIVRSSDGSPIRWSRTIEAGTEWIDLREGRFLLEVHTRSATTRVAVRVPDGRIEDLGTIFEVWVEGGRTTRVRVAEGRVALWLRGALGSIVTSGEEWGTTPIPREPPPTIAAPAPQSGPRALRRRTGGELAQRHAQAEDAAYLKVIRLLRAGRTTEAKEAARDYVLRFPDGFRVEELGRVAGP